MHYVSLVQTVEKSKNPLSNILCFTDQLRCMYKVVKLIYLLEVCFIIFHFLNMKPTIHEAAIRCFPISKPGGRADLPIEFLGLSPSLSDPLCSPCLLRRDVLCVGVVPLRLTGQLVGVEVAPVISTRG